MRYSSRYILLTLCTLFFACKEEPVIVEDKEEDTDLCRTEPLEIYESCVEEPNPSSFDIATWNIEFFPQQDDKTVTAVKNIINSFQADVIAVQEISNTTAFLDLADQMSGWEAQVINDGNLSLGFIYNTCEVESATTIKSLEIGGFSPFPRSPVEITLKHMNGLEVTLINIHLKCCDDGYNRRIEASELLKKYIDEEYPSENVILLGDFNDRIHGENPPFENFIIDTENYLFADMIIAEGGTNNYSYPSWPSHLDHLLITNELFDNLDGTQTVRLDDCYNPYFSIVSDHRPVMISLLNE